MERHAAAMVRGTQRAIEAWGATAGIVGIKARNRHAAARAEAACRGTAVRAHLFGDDYPAGDEYDAVYTPTGRLISPTGIPSQVGAAGCNIETCFNIAAPVEGRAVTRQTRTIAGSGGGGENTHRANPHPAAPLHRGGGRTDGSPIRWSASAACSWASRRITSTDRSRRRLAV